VKAAVFQALGQPLRIEEVAVPKAAADEVVIQVGRCGICGSDLHMTHDPVFGVQQGAVLGHEFAGEVVEIGRDVRGLKVGDRVAAAPVRGCGQCSSCLAGEPAWCQKMLLQGGGYAEFVTATQRQCLKLPASTSVADGALVEPLAVALHGVVRGKVAPGSRVLVIGAGPIGLGVVFWARRLGATGVAVSDLTTLQRDLAYGLGATAFEQTGPDAVARIAAALGGAPEIVFECVGKPGLLRQSLEHVGRRGRVVVLGLCTVPDSFVPFEAVSKEVDFVTSAFFDMHEYQASLDVLDGGKAPPSAMVTDTVSLAAMPPVFEALRQRTSQCKVLVQPGK
jgi:(R,R)-butanediol dehydrogenase / meso-butanediol dehydrogenase / diacetyl reductase